MHSVKEIKDDPAKLDKGLVSRGLEPISEKLLKIDIERRAQIQISETTRALLNKLSNDFKKLGHAPNEQKISEIRNEIKFKKGEMSAAEEKLKALDTKLNDILLSLPNIPSSDCPQGMTENDNVEIHRWGKVREFKFKPKEHFDIPAAKGLDFEISSKISGSRFVVLRSQMAKLHRAIGQFMLDVHAEENNLEETWVPVLVNSKSMFGTGNLPKFAEDSYQTKDGKWLIPTAEVPLTNIVANSVLLQSELPKRLVAHSQCFRSEAGSAGKDTKGMLRQHQFEKVEMVTVCIPENSDTELTRMKRCAEKILEMLNLPYRTVILCTGDMGFSSEKTYDIEVWLPGQNKYREISSCSNCGDFQARRMSARYKESTESKPKLVNTLNGSGLAVGRCLIAILENYQEIDGSLVIPKALIKYMGGYTNISPQGKLEK
ncbi:MAG: serine--tRNA ligase [Paracoccaceae bacterium]